MKGEAGLSKEQKDINKRRGKGRTGDQMEGRNDVNIIKAVSHREDVRVRAVKTRSIHQVKAGDETEEKVLLSAERGGQVMEG